ncbi:MAG: rod shape-determining protein RodA [Bacteroidetes bacterium HGW-Bacteroidetes-6]|jgi:rod shape determining protein RodA|nr:MAG: rod shape-determining protein RodA [Bacteroidetes bacterium HGW-Bacteroidetes-6]
MNQLEARSGKIDFGVLFVILALMAIGWLSIFATSYQEGNFGLFDFSYAYGRQSVWILSSLILGLMIMIVDVRFLPRMSFSVFVGVLGLLLLVLALGTVISGSRSWIDLGAGVRLQPAEFAKYGAALFFAKYLSVPGVSFDNTTHRRNLLLIVLIPALLVFFQGDTGSAIVFGSFILIFYRIGMPGFYVFLVFYIAALFVATLLIKQFVLLLLLLAAFSALIYLSRNKRTEIIRFLLMFFMSAVFIVSVNYIFSEVLKPHQKDRINVLIGKEYNPRGSAFNVNQSLIAIGSGGFEGKGFLQGTQTKYNFVPEQSTDFIFCTVGEEWGFVGSSITVLLFVFVLIRLIILAEKQRSEFSKYYIYSVAAIVFVHFLVNIGMTIAVIPVIGIPLPFVSYGGSAMWAFTLMLFTVLKLNMHRNSVL